MTERRIITVYATAPHRLVDYELALTAAGSDALFGDTKEGGFISLRVASSMDASAAGRLENARGGVGESEVWGKRAEWCDYSGPVEGKMAGVAFLESPTSFGHPTYWHARDYGLMSANPSASQSSWARATTATTPCPPATPSPSATASTSTTATPAPVVSPLFTAPTPPRPTSSPTESCRETQSGGLRRSCEGRNPGGGTGQGSPPRRDEEQLLEAVRRVCTVPDTRAVPTQA